MKKKMFMILAVVLLSLTGFTLESTSGRVTVSGFCRYGSSEGPGINGVGVVLQNMQTGEVHTTSSGNMGFYSTSVDANSEFNCSYEWNGIKKTARNSSSNSDTSFPDVIF